MSYGTLKLEMVVHMNMGKVHQLKQKATVNRPGHKLHGFEFFIETTTTKGTGKKAATTETLYYIGGENTPEFTTFKEFGEHYKLFEI